MSSFSVKGNIVDVVKKEIFQGEIFVKEGIVEKIERKNVDSEKYIVPGFIDAHIHIESSMLIPSEFARLAVVHGTVATVSDPHEIANVVGIDGVRYMIDNGKKVSFKFFFGAPSCVPATKFETAGAEIGVEGIEELMSWPEIKYLTEMMNFPGVLFKDPEVISKINIAHEKNKPVDGHAPGLRGEDAKKYIESGITTDHECFTKEEALDKLKYGMKIIIREGSAAKNFDALISLLDEYPEMIMFGSDDKHPNELVLGHLNLIAARAVAEGADTMNVLRALSYNPVKHYNLEVGLLQINDPADFIILNNLIDFDVESTFINGELVASQKVSKIKSINEQEINQFNCNKIKLSDILIKNESNKIRVIEVIEGQLITKEFVFKPNGKDLFIESDIESDVLKLVVVNRYFNSKPAIAFVKNFGLKYGAIASSIAHDSHNIIAVGVNNQEIMDAINLVIHSKGGVSYADEKEQIILPLPVAGLMSTDDGYRIAEKYDYLDKRTKKAGSSLAAPYMSLSFLALLVIPELKLSDKGLFDGKEFKLTSLYYENKEESSSL